MSGAKEMEDEVHAAPRGLHWQSEWSSLGRRRANRLQRCGIELEEQKKAGSRHNRREHFDVDQARAQELEDMPVFELWRSRVARIKNECNGPCCQLPSST